MSRWVFWVSRHPGWTLLGVLALTLFSITGLVDLRTGKVLLRVDPSASELLPKTGPERELYERSRKLFGTDESIVVGVGAPDVFDPDVLRRIVTMTRSLEEIDGVQSVLSLATARNIRAIEYDVFVAPIIPEDGPPDEPAELERIRREVLANPLYAGSLVALDSRATALVVSLERMSDQQLVRRGVDPAIEAAARQAGAGLEVWIAGVPHQKVYTGTQLNRELSWMLPLILALLGLVVVVSLRTVRGLVLVHGTILLALLWTLGTLAWLGQQLNVVTITIPFLVLTIGFSYALHVVTEYYAELRAEPGLGSQEAVRRTLEAVAVPVLVTGLTTGAGFISLAVSPLPAVSQFGLFSVLGVAFTLLAALTLTPAALAILATPRRRRDETESLLLDRVADQLAEFSTDRRRAAIIGSFVVLAVALVGMTQIRVAIKFPGNMSPDHPIRRDYEQINERLGGANQLRIVIDAADRDEILEPRNLTAIRSLQQWLDEQPEVGRTASIVDYLMLLNRAMHGDDPEYFAVPETRRLASQLLLFGSSDQTQRLLNARRQTTTVLVNLKEGDSDRITGIVDRMQAKLESLPLGLEGGVTGSAALLLRATDDVSRGQLISISLAFGLIYAVLVVMFTSFRVGLLALFPNVLPIAVYFGALGLSGVTLNPSTSLVGSLALGIAVDDTIHYFARFNVEAKRHADEKLGARAALRALIRPVTFTTLGLCAGFLVLTGSEQGSLVQFGMLAAFTIAVAWLVDVTLSPALCSGVRIVTLWDVLRLDLGERPQDNIGLFHGLSERQTRVFALMSKIRELGSGERLLTQGEQGGDMFVILKGQLEAWIEDRGRQRLRLMGRGEVVGEVGLFAARRSANVDASEDAMLIGFDHEDLERLRIQYPRIAAAVYRNLNEIQARRMLDRTPGAQTVPARS
jgi:predicted RND superfamily exporter protein